MHWITVAVWGVCVCVIAAIWSYDRRKAPRPRAPWPQWPDDERDLTLISRYARARAAESDGGLMDERTWTDLNMDDVFRVLDRAESRVGQQVLYGRLRSAPVAAHVDAFERLATRLETDPAARAAAADALGRMRGVDAYDVWWLTEPGTFEVRPWHVVFPILAAAMIGVAIAGAVYPALLLFLVAGSLVSVALRATAAWDLRVAVGAFRGVEPVLRAAEALRPQVAGHEALLEPLQLVGGLAMLRRVARWAGRDTSGAVSGELSSTIFEYLNLVFALDGNALFFGARQLRAHGGVLATVMQAVGEVDAALSVASYRTATPGWTRPVFQSSGSATFEALRHPLVPDAVPNTIALGPPQGLILTGSNMSGKTTFLRTLGVNVVLAQTIRTCLCARYEAPALVVRSCIGRGDDPASGRSYYLVEVQAVLALVEAARDARPHLFLFDELFRGTNTVERIAAGDAVLASLAEPPDGRATSPHIVVAATHDLELVELLADRYAAFHFTDRVGTDGLEFDYQLQPGPSLTRNAIALLRVRGAPAALVARAIARADQLDAARRETAPP